MYPDLDHVKVSVVVVPGVFCWRSGHLHRHGHACGTVNGFALVRAQNPKIPPSSCTSSTTIGQYTQQTTTMMKFTRLAVLAVSCLLLSSEVQAFAPSTVVVRSSSWTSANANTRLLASIPSPDDFKSPDTSVTTTTNSAQSDVEKKEIPEVAIYGAASVILLAISYASYLQVTDFIQSGAALEQTGHIAVMLGQLLLAIGSGLFQALTIILPFLGKAAVAGVQAAAPVVEQAATAATPYVQEATSQLGQAASPYVQQATAQVSTVAAPLVQQAQTLTSEALQQANALTDSVTQQATEQITGSLEQVTTSIPKLFE